jgi:hypothetical protein
MDTRTAASVLDNESKCLNVAARPLINPQDMEQSAKEAAAIIRCDLYCTGNKDDRGSEIDHSLMEKGDCKIFCAKGQKLERH